jgi:hypothetical protein
MLNPTIMDVFCAFVARLGPDFRFLDLMSTCVVWYGEGAEETDQGAGGGEVRMILII